MANWQYIAGETKGEEKQCQALVWNYNFIKIILFKHQNKNVLLYNIIHILS